MRFIMRRTWNYLSDYVLGNDSDDESVSPLEHAVDDIDGRDSDDETYDPANPDLEEYF